MTGARQEQQASSGRVVVGVHGSASSMDALRWAAKIARDRGWELEIVAVWPDADEVFIRDVPGRYMVARGAAMAALNRAVAAVLEYDPGVSTFLMNSRPAQALLARGHEADLVVVGAGRPQAERGRRAVGDELAARSCPVLVVSSDLAARDEAAEDAPQLRAEPRAGGERARHGRRSRAGRNAPLVGSNQ